MVIVDIYFHGVLCKYYRFAVMISFMIFIILEIQGIMALTLDFGIVCLGQTNNLDNIIGSYKNKRKETDV